MRHVPATRDWIAKCPPEAAHVRSVWLDAQTFIPRSRSAMSALSTMNE